jgi:hypothetical protein
MTCENCKFYRVLTGAEKSEFGECVRFPPIVSAGGYRFPVVKKDLWCGELKNPQKKIG